MRRKSLNLTANGVMPTRWRARNHMSLSTAARKVRPIDSPIDSHTALTRWQISAMVIFGRGYRCLRGSKCPGTNSTEVCVCVPASILSSIVTLSTRSLLLSHHLILQRRQDGFASKSDTCRGIAWRRFCEIPDALTTALARSQITGRRRP